MVEALATRSRTPVRNLVAAAVTFPLGLLVLALLVIQVTYAVTMVETGDPAKAGREALKIAAEIPRIPLQGFFVVSSLLVSVPLTTYFRLQGHSRVQQLWRVVPGTAVLALVCAVLAAASSREDSMPVERVTVEVLVPTALSTIIGVLLPGAWVRSDQLEAWVLRKIRAWQE